MSRPFNGRALFFAAVVLSSLFLPEMARACELCFWTIWNPARAYCRPVQGTETGTTICDNAVDNSGGSWCTEGGDYCGVVNAGGGSGGSGGGGGGGSCNGGGFCPAECFSCGGGGGGGYSV